MTKIVNSITDLIGNTPIVKLNRVVPEDAADIYVKLEFFNPAGSIKDRIALAMIEKAEREGKLKPGDTIVEPTSGNTGIGLAAVASAKGYHLIIAMPETMSEERRSCGPTGLNCSSRQARTECQVLSPWPRSWSRKRVTSCRCSLKTQPTRKFTN